VATVLEPKLPGFKAPKELAFFSQPSPPLPFTLALFQSHRPLADSQTLQAYSHHRTFALAVLSPGMLFHPYSCRARLPPQRGLTCPPQHCSLYSSPSFHPGLISPVISTIESNLVYASLKLFFCLPIEGFWDLSVSFATVFPEHCT
jgi:hypothetical protein